MYSSYSFLSSALDGGEYSASRSGRALAPGNGPPVPTVQEAGWAPEPVWKVSLALALSVTHSTSASNHSLPVCVIQLEQHNIRLIRTLSYLH
jgi:hypothetical protein